MIGGVPQRLLKQLEAKDVIIARVRHMKQLKQELLMYQRVRLELAQKQRNMIEKFLRTREKLTEVTNRSLSLPVSAPVTRAARALSVAARASLVQQSVKKSSDGTQPTASVSAVV